MSKKNSVVPEAEALFQQIKADPICNLIRIPPIWYTEGKVPDCLVEDCESPIEQILLVALECQKPDLMEIIPQVNITTPPNYKFRADFVVGLNWASLFAFWEYQDRVEEWLDSEVYWLPFFAVECDGREYHNQHEAIQRDKQRDRIFSSRGMPVLRFTGSEIFRNPLKCASEVIEMFLRNLRERLMRGGITQEELKLMWSREIILGKAQSK